MPVNPPLTDSETRSETLAAPERDGAETPATTPRRQPILGLSASQLTGSAAAAATAAALGSRLGLVGTIVGAALISVVTAVAGAVYTRSLQRTKDAMARTAERLPTVRIAAQRAEPPDERRTTTRWWHRVRWRRVTVAALAVFLLAGGIVTGVEQLTGRSLDGTGRTSVDHLLGEGGSLNRSIERKQGDGSRTTPSDGSTGSGPSDSSTSGDGTGSSTSGDQEPSSTPTPTDQPSTTPTEGTDGDSGTGTTEPSPQPSADPTTTPTTGSGTGSGSGSGSGS